MAKFAELLDTAIANADSRDQLTASRARLLTAGRRGPPPGGAGPARRRAAAAGAHDRDAQARSASAPRTTTARRSRSSARRSSTPSRATRELRELAHGILPAVLTRGGLRAGVDAVVAAARPSRRGRRPGRAVPGRDRGERLLHRRRGAHERRQARARRARRGHGVACEDGTLRIEVRDDGIGGADPDGHGLVGMRDRVDRARRAARDREPRRRRHARGRDAAALGRLGPLGSSTSGTTRALSLARSAPTRTSAHQGLRQAWEAGRPLARPAPGVVVDARAALHRDLDSALRLGVGERGSDVVQTLSPSAAVFGEVGAALLEGGREAWMPRPRALPSFDSKSLARRCLWSSMYIWPLARHPRRHA